MASVWGCLQWPVSGDTPATDPTPLGCLQTMPWDFVGTAPRFKPRQEYFYSTHAQVTTLPAICHLRLELCSLKARLQTCGKRREFQVVFWIPPPVFRISCHFQCVSVQIDLSSLELINLWSGYDEYTAKKRRKESGC